MVALWGPLRAAWGRSGDVWGLRGGAMGASGDCIGVLWVRPLRGEEGTEMATTARVTKSSASCESFKDIGHQFRPGRGPFRAFQFRPSVVPLCHAHIYVGPLVFLSFSETTQFMVLFASHEKYIFIPDSLPKRTIICHPAYRLSESIV